VLSRVKSYNERLVDERPALYRFAFSLSKNRDRAEDLVQDTMLRAITHRHLFEEGTNFRGWLFVILRNKHRSDYRKDKRLVEDVDDVHAKKVAVEDSPLKKLEVVELLRFVGKMPVAFRVPLLLVADGASYEEAAVEMTEQVGTIKSRVNRGRAMLKMADKL
jgi:RNA polymerase sigma-70 factor (ECF subfamily)